MEEAAKELARWLVSLAQKMGTGGFFVKIERFGRVDVTLDPEQEVD